MAKAIATYSGGIQYLAQAALREDGTMFYRLQERGRYGYQWTKWKVKTKYAKGHIPKFVPVGFNDLRKTNFYNAFKCRLPDS